MLGQVLSPGVQEGGDGELGAQMTGVASEAVKGLLRRAEEKLVEQAAVVEDQLIELVGQGEDHMKVADRKEQCALRLEPLRSREALALRAVSIAAGVVGDACGAAAVAGVEVPAQSRRSAPLDGPHCSILGFGEPVLAAVVLAVSAKDLCDFKPWSPPSFSCR